jgi:phosphatidylserine/phosphatidylglycerophosphate/cardiolipin synthase-like enzyme
VLGIIVVTITAVLLFYRGRAPTRTAPAEPLGEACGGTSGHACQLTFLGTEPDDGIQPLLDQFAGAKVSIDYVPFTLDDPRINLALSQAKARGVEVRVMLEPEPSDDVRLGARAGTALGKLGIEWKSSNPAFNLTHAKYAVIDGTRALLLTFNSTAADLATRRDFGLVDDDADHTRYLQSLFDADWNRTAAPTIPTGFVVSPGNSNEALVAFVGSAQRSLDLYAERLDPSPLLDAIVKAARRGVLVRVLAAPLEPKDRAAAKLDDVLRGGNFELEIPRAPKVHAKVIIVDGTRVFLGSENVEDSPKERRREVGMIFEDGTITSRLLAVFERDWADAGPVSR